MVQSIELLLDDGSEARVRAQWTALRDAGLPSLAAHEGATNRPHVTVAVAEDGLAAAAAAVGAVARGWDLGGAGLPVVIGPVLLFGGHRGRWVLARGVVARRPLLTLHAAVHRAVAQAAPESAVDPKTLPDAWTPHVTIAQRMPAERLAEALALLDPEPIACRAVGLRLWDSVPKTVTPL